MSANAAELATPALSESEARRAEMLTDGRDPDLPANHPINALSRTRKTLIMATLAYCGFLSQFAVAIILVALVPLAVDLKVTPGDIASTIGYSLLGYAVGPLFWNPLCRTVGRRPVYLLGSLIFLPVCIWLALSPNYASFAVARVFLGLTLAFSQTVPPATVADIFVPAVRGQKMAMYAVAVVTAPAIAPFFCGLIIHKASWRVLFWFCLGLGGLQFIMFFFLVPETLWVEDTPGTGEERIEEEKDRHAASTETKDTIAHLEAHPHIHGAMGHGSTGHVGAEWMPWHRPAEYLLLCVSPVAMLRYIVIIVPSFYYGLLFAWMVGITVVTPQTLGAPPFNFRVIPLGCAFLAYGIGGVLGLWSGGLVGDKTVAYFARRNGRREPEDRLWALLPILPLKFLGLLIMGLDLKFHWHWIGLLVGGGIYFFCLSAATGVLQTYVLETYLPKSMDTMAVFNFWRMMWGFAVAFFAYNWGLKSGFLEEYITQGALAAGLGFILCAALIWKGRAIRQWQGMPMFE